MSDDRVTTAYERYAEASQRFEYFVTGGAGTVLAYTVQTYTPVPDGWAFILLPIAWGLLLLTLAFGLWRIQLAVEHFKTNVASLHAAQEGANAQQVAMSGRPALLVAVGGVVSPAQAADIARMYRDVGADVDKHFRKLERRAVWSFRLRNLSLVGGLAALAAWRVLNL